MIDKLRQTYSGKKVFLTGHTGFKGSWLLAILHHVGAEVMGYALAPEEEPAMYKLIGGDNLCHSVIADIRDKARIAEEIKNFQPDFIFHLAAQSLVRRSFTTPTETYETNVLGTAYLLDGLRQLEKACQVVIITTDKVYENREWVYPYREEDPLGGFDPYSSSKACAEIAAASFRRSFFHPAKYAEHHKAIATARAGNVIGGGDWAQDRIIPDFIRALTAGNPLVVRNPASVRPWEHVLEPLSGYLTLGTKHAEDTLTVKDLVEKSLNIWGSGSFEARIDPNAPHEAKLLKLDISLALDELGWSPRWNAAKAIETTLDWYKNYQSNPLGTTIAQAEAYFNS